VRVIPPRHGHGMPTSTEAPSRLSGSQDVRRASTQNSDTSAACRSTTESAVRVEYAGQVLTATAVPAHAHLYSADLLVGRLNRPKHCFHRLDYFYDAAQALAYSSGAALGEEQSERRSKQGVRAAATDAADRP
jgi:hypothetical protein